VLKVLDYQIIAADRVAADRQPFERRLEKRSPQFTGRQNSSGLRRTNLCDPFYECLSEMRLT
jgi:hypothetical protein